MTGAVEDVQMGEATRRGRERAWIALRVGIPCAVGLWTALLALEAEQPAWRLSLFVLFTSLLALCLFLTLGKGSGLAETSLRLFRRQCVFLGLAAVGSGLAHLCFRIEAVPRLSAIRGCSLGLGLATVGSGMGAIVMTSLQDWRIQDLARRRYALSLLPWLMACELGLLGAWLIVRPLGATLLPAKDQRLLSLVVALIMVELLIFLRWVVPASPRDVLLHEPLRGPKERTTILTHLRSWGGRILPAVLLVLTITNEGVYWAFVAWVLVLAGHVIRYYLLTRALCPAPGADSGGVPQPATRRN